MNSCGDARGGNSGGTGGGLPSLSQKAAGTGRMVRHNNGGRHDVALQQFDFVGSGSVLFTTELLHKASRAVNGNNNTVQYNT